MEIIQVSDDLVKRILQDIFWKHCLIGLESPSRERNIYERSDRILEKYVTDNAEFDWRKYSEKS